MLISICIKFNDTLIYCFCRPDKIIKLGFKGDEIILFKKT